MDNDGMNRAARSLAVALMALPLVGLASCSTTTGATTRPVDTTGAMTFTNPLKVDGADPWIGYHDGYYHLTSTTAVNIQMRRAKTLEGLKTAEDQIIWTDETPGRSRDIWATEFHRLDDGTGTMRWYGYYTAAHFAVEPTHRMFVIESEGDDPMGPYHFKAQLKTDAADEQFAIDGGAFRAGDGSLYFVWCGRPSPYGQGLYLQKMSDPWTLEGERVALDADGFGCEHIREGPVALRRNGRIFLVYSMCGADTPDYRLGMLVADENADLLDPASWTQHPEVVLSRNDDAKAYGPGHNFFFQSPDGTEDWIVFHVKTTTYRTFDDRVTFAQPFTWNADGTPNFGTPLAVGTPIKEPSGTRGE